jgi:ABC-2 type transport system ATP-binding protein
MGITFNQVSAGYEDRKVLSQVHLTLGNGITAVMGKNGAGKTTFLELAAGILDPLQGEMLLDGNPYHQSQTDLHQNLGFLPQELDFPDHLTPRHFLRYMASLRFLDFKEGLSILTRLGGGEWLDRKFENLSTGEIRLTGIAQALMGAPRIIILDEFSRNLSTEERLNVMRSLELLSTSRMILLSTHLCEDAAEMAGRVILLEDGEISFDGNPEKLVRAASGFVFRVKSPELEACRDVKRLNISHTEIIQGEKWVRVVGKIPQGVKYVPVEPTFEEAYLYYFQQKRLKLR